MTDLLFRLGFASFWVALVLAFSWPGWRDIRRDRARHARELAELEDLARRCRDLTGESGRD